MQVLLVKIFVDNIQIAFNQAPQKLSCCFCENSQLYKLHISQKYGFQVWLFLKLHTWKKYIAKGKCLEGVDIDLLVTPEKFKTQKSKNELNKYKKKAGLSLKEWHDFGWIHKQDPYGWIQWYCEFYDGRRSPDDNRQINRWIKFAGETQGRWNKNLMNKIIKSDTTFDDFTISPIIRQSLQHWAYQLTKEDFEKYKKNKL